MIVGEEVWRRGKYWDTHPSIRSSPEGIYDDDLIGETITDRIDRRPPQRARGESLERIYPK